MQPTVWHSRIMSDASLGIRQGVAAKWFGREWDTPTHIAPPTPSGTMESMMRYVRGEPQPREAFPEALYVFDRKQFNKIGDLFTAGSFYAVKSKLAEVFFRFDLGRGGLIPLPIYQDDKVTPVPGEFYIWNLGVQKNAFLPERSPKIRPSGIGQSTMSGHWEVDPNVEDGDIALSAASAGPPDVWCDPRLLWSLFFSDALAAALRSAEIKTDFHLRRCRLIA
jgi:hypothetical protein